MTTEVPTFASLHLSPKSMAALAHMGYKTPTPVQARAIPPALEGRDVIGCAATGTGKTAAFVLPMLERLEGKKGIRALVLAPTRELVEQISEQFALLGHGRTLRCAAIIGGVGMGGQEHALRSQHEVIVATPGRLLDHMDRGNAPLQSLEILVLDEADRMLDMGFRPQLDRILARVPKQRQTMLFSATMGGEVAAFARGNLRDPVRVEVVRSGTTAARAEQRVYLCSQDEKTPLLLALLAADEDSTLVFTRTKHRADKVARAVERAGFDVSRIHGNRSQNQRRASLDGFRDGTHRVLVATDIAARGLDVEDIGHVILYDLPHVAEDYIHRVGRTARADASGRASTLCAPDEVDLLRAIEKLTRVPVARATVPRDSPAFAEARRLAALKPAPTPHREGEHAARGKPRRKTGAASRVGGRKKAPASSSSSSGKAMGSWRPRGR